MTAPSFRTPATTVTTAHGTIRHVLHHLNLPRARTVATRQLTAAASALQATFDERSMMCLAAPAGAGKTFTLHTALDNNPHWQAIRILPRPQARAEDLRHSLHHALALPGPPPADPGTGNDLIRHTLHHPARLLAVDEAHHLSASCQEYLRYLHDDPLTQIAVVLATGSHRLRALHATTMLASRITCWHELDAISNQDIPTVLPAFHPHWKTTDPTVLLQLNAAWAHGNFRRWATLTHRAIRIAQRDPHAAADPTALLHRLTPRPDTT